MPPPALATVALRRWRCAIVAALERAAGALQAVLTRSVAECAEAHGGARWALAAQLAGQGAQRPVLRAALVAAGRLLEIA